MTARDLTRELTIINSYGSQIFTWHWRSIFNSVLLHLARSVVKSLSDAFEMVSASRSSPLGDFSIV